MSTSFRIAVADDEPDMREYFQMVLQRLGHLVVASEENGRALVTACGRTRPDLVITDVCMPELDGIDAAVRICEGRPVPVILVTAYPSAELVQRAEMEHIMGYLVKPIRQTELAQAITSAMTRFAEIHGDSLVSAPQDHGGE